MITAERGFVLPAMLLLLVMFTGIALTAATMASQQIRSSSDLRSSVMAFHAAEGGAAWVANRFASGDLEWLAGDTLAGADLEGVSDAIPVSAAGGPNHGDAIWWVESMAFDDEEVTYQVVGEVLPTATRRSVRVTYQRGEGGSTSPFASAVVGCEGITLSGSAVIDSWDSQMYGQYAPGLAQANANVGTLAGNGDVVLSGSSPIRGDVLSARDIRVSGSAQVQGDYRAIRNIQFNGNPSCPTADVEAGGAISTPGAWWMGGCGNPEWDEGADIDFTPQPCDPLNVAQFVADSMAAYRPDSGDFENWPHTGWRPNPVHIDSNQAYNSFSIGPGAHPVTLDAGAVDFLYVAGNFSLTSSAQLHIQNPSMTGAPQQVKLFVEGNVSASGASRLNIDPGVSLLVFTTGRISISGGHSQSILPTVNVAESGEPRIQPTLGLFTSFAGGGNGVSISGNSPLSAVVYAPLSAVAVSGSGDLYGAVQGRTVSVSGGAGIHYDEALGLMGGAASTGAIASRIVLWEQVP